MKATLLTLAFTTLALPLFAQEDGPPRPAEGGGHRPPPHPLMIVLDQNKDGQIDSAEIDAAPAALDTLDKNGDGVLTREEFCPPPPQEGGRPPRKRPEPASPGE